MARDELDDILGPRSRITLPSVARPTDTPSSEKKPYEAFHPVDRQQITAWFRPRLRAWEALPYIRLDRVVTDGVYGSRVAAIYGFAVIVIKGRHLEELATSLAQFRVSSVDEFDPARFLPPTDPAAPYIDSIEIHVESREDMLAAAEEAAGAIRQ